MIRTAVKAYPHQVWHLTEDRFWSLCGRWMRTLCAQWDAVSDIPESEKVCAHCARKEDQR